MAKRKALTEDLWLSCPDPEVLFFALAKTQAHAEFAVRLRANAGKRKLRLFAAACCRTIWDLLDDEGRLLQCSVETCELEADQLANNLQLKLAEQAAYELWEEWQQPWDQEDPHVEAAGAVLSAADPDAAMAVFTYEHTATARLKANELFGVITSSRQSMVEHGAYDPELAILRDICNPFANSPFDAAALGERLAGVRAQARRIYQERAFGDMPALADALEEASCTDTKLIKHCREGQTHVRGCWAIDLILDWK